jgi:ABC-type branched-subunit amino acid transport system substrate-binding protein
MSDGQVGIEEDTDDLPLTGTITVTATPTNQVRSNLTRSYFAIPINDGQVTGFTVGGLFPLSVNGTASTVGVQLAEAFKCSLNAANNNQGIIRNISMLYSIQDSGVEQNQAFNQALLLERRGTFAVVGPQNNVQVVPVANLYNTANTPLVSYGAGSILLGNSTIYPTFLRVWPPDTFQARAMAETFRLLGWTFIAALFTNDEYGQSGRQALLQATSRQRIRVTCLNNIFPNATTGLQSFSDCVAASDATVVVLWMGPESASAVISQMYSNPLNNRTTFVAANEWAIISNVPAFIDLGKRVTGLSYPQSFLEGSLGFYPFIGSTALVRACFSQVNPSNTNYTQFNEVWERRFSCSITDDDTLSLCDEDFRKRTGRCRCRGNEDFNAIPLPPNINYAYDAGTVYSNALNSIINPKTCGRLIGGDYCNLTELTSIQLLNSAIQSGFRGLTGDVSFNRTNPDRRSTSYSVMT